MKDMSTNHGPDATAAFDKEVADLLNGWEDLPEPCRQLSPKEAATLLTALYVPGDTWVHLHRGEGAVHEILHIEGDELHTSCSRHTLDGGSSRARKTRRTLLSALLPELTKVLGGCDNTLTPEDRHRG